MSTFEQSLSSTQLLCNNLYITRLYEANQRGAFEVLAAPRVTRT